MIFKSIFNLLTFGNLIFFFKVVSGKIVHLWFLAKVVDYSLFIYKMASHSILLFFLYPVIKIKVSCVARGVKISRLLVPKTSTALEQIAFLNSMPKQFHGMLVWLLHDNNSFESQAIP